MIASLAFCFWFAVRLIGGDWLVELLFCFQELLSQRAIYKIIVNGDCLIMTG